MRRIDLHTHSTHSDGTLSPERLLALAEKRRLAALAITDHDTVAGVDPLLAAAHGPVEVISGIELSTHHHHRSLHLLGYGFDHRHPGLRQRLAILQQQRRQRNQQIVARLNQLGIDISLAEAEALAGDQVGRPHIARLLVAKGVVDTIQAGFERFLKRGGAAYVESYRISTSEAIGLIQEAHGLTVLAHPGCADPTLADTETLLAELRAAGLDGVEAYHPCHPPQTTAALLRLAGRLGLLVSGGTDFHGDLRNGIPLGGGNGLRVPYTLFTAIKKQLAAASPSP